MRSLGKVDSMVGFKEVFTESMFEVGYEPKLI